MIEEKDGPIEREVQLVTQKFYDPNNNSRVFHLESFLLLFGQTRR